MEEDDGSVAVVNAVVAVAELQLAVVGTQLSWLDEPETTEAAPLVPLLLPGLISLWNRKRKITELEQSLKL